MIPENAETLQAIPTEVWTQSEILDAEGRVAATGRVILSADGSGLFQPSGQRRIDSLEHLAKSVRFPDGRILWIEGMELCIVPSCDYHIQV